MFLRLKLLTFNISSAILLIIFLCLGSQNLQKRYSLDILINKTVELPIGFILGVSFTLGILSGGISSTLLVDDENKNKL